MENKSLKMLIIALVLIYAVAPDLIPGPVDDLLVMALGYFMTSKKDISNLIHVDEV